MIAELRHLPYVERLPSLGLMSTVKRLREDMLDVFKILNGIDNVDREHFFVYLRSTLRGHNTKLSKPRSRVDIRKFTYCHRVTDAWNSLPKDVIDSWTVNTFKNRVDQYLVCRGLI